MTPHDMDWLPNALTKLVALSRLGDKGDYQGPGPVSADSLGWAMKFLERVSACELPEPHSSISMGSGRVTFKWKSLVGADIELELLPNGTRFKAQLWDGERLYAESLADAVKWVRVHATPISCDKCKAVIGADVERRVTIIVPKYCPEYGRVRLFDEEHQVFYQRLGELCSSCQEDLRVELAALAESYGIAAGAVKEVDPRLADLGQRVVGASLRRGL